MKPYIAYNLIPSGGIARDATEDIVLKWSVKDPNPSHIQQAYQVQYKENVIGSTVTDTGWVVSSVPQHTITANTLTNGKYWAWRVRYRDNTEQKQEIATLTITAGCNANGNVTIYLNGVATNVALTTAQNTPQLVASIIRGTSFSGWTTGGSGATVTFTATTYGNKDDASYSAGVTGALGTMTTTTQGSDYISSDWSDWVLFKTSAKPSCSILYPQNDDDIITTEILSFSHQFVDEEGLPQKSYQYNVYADDNTLLWTSDLLTDFNNLVVPPKGLLQNNTYYKVDVTVTDSDGLQATSIKRRFYTNFPPTLPNSPDFTVTPENDKSHMKLRWVNIKSIPANYEGSGVRFKPCKFGNGVEISEYGEKVYWNIDIPVVFTVCKWAKLNEVNNGTLLFLNKDEDNYMRFFYDVVGQRFILEKCVNGNIRTTGSSVTPLLADELFFYSFQQKVDGTVIIHTGLEGGSLEKWGDL